MVKLLPTCRMIYLHIEISQEQSRHTIMLTDYQKLIYMTQKIHASGRIFICNK